MIGRARPAFALAVLLAACGAAPPDRVVRRVAGERVVGTFVSPFSYEWFIRAELALEHGDLEAAAEAYRMARAGPEDDPLVLARLADVLDRLERVEEADAVLDEGLELDPESEAVWLAAGRIAERRGRIERALEAYARAESAAPRSEQAPLALARLLRERGAPARAERVLLRFTRRGTRQTAGVLRARLELALAREDTSGATRAVDALLRVAPARSAEVTRVATAALADDRPVLAARLLDAVPESLVDTALRVRALARAGRLERAEAVLATALEERVGGPLGRARLYLTVRRADRAAEIADAVVATSSDPQAWLVAGLAHLDARREVEAAPLLARVPRGVRGYAESRVALASALDAQGLGTLAAEVLETALSGPVDDEGAVVEALAEHRMQRDDWGGALSLWEGRSGRPAEVGRARTLDRAGRVREASEAYRALASDGHALPGAVRARARAEELLASEQPGEAISLLSRRVERAPDDLLARVRLAELLLAAGRAAEAREVASRTLALAIERPMRRRLEAVTR